MKEWLETDGWGGFALGCEDLVCRRRYHSLLTTCDPQSANRFTLINAVEVELSLDGSSYLLHEPGIGQQIVFSQDPLPRWKYFIQERHIVTFFCFINRHQPATVLLWRLEPESSCNNATLLVSPLLTGRSIHSLHFQNPGFNFDALVDQQQVTWNPYHNIPPVSIRSNGLFLKKQGWMKSSLYSFDIERGYDGQEDLACTGTFQFDLKQTPASLILSSYPVNHEHASTLEVAQDWLNTEKQSRLRDTEKIALATQAEHYVIKRGLRKSIIAGYPWFADWGRDTFISMRGLLLSQKKYTDAKDILISWADSISEGMIPNLFPDTTSTSSQPHPAEYNSVDASLWYVIAAFEYMSLTADHDQRLLSAMESIVTHYQQGTRFNIHMDPDDHLLACGDPQKSTQLTWMDAKVGDMVFTPRIGKPVEIQCLWINVLFIATKLLHHPETLPHKALDSFQKRFWNESEGILYDVVDVDHIPGQVDTSMRPNQMLAVGGLPFQCLDISRGKKIFEKIIAELYTPHGIRTLSPRDPRYRGRYEGDPFNRDSAYHQGTAWSWLMGPFIEGWVRINGETPAVKRQAFERFIEPWLYSPEAKQQNYLSEIADGDFPHQWRGAPFQAWSVGEAIRMLAYLN